MPDMYFDVDTALTEVPVNLMPLIDDTDFKSRETTIAYNAAGMDLVWNFVTSAGSFTQTAVTPTTAGNYDWTHQGDGIYTIEIPASGGASINNDTEGYGWFTGFVTGVLPWRGPVIGFRAAAINDALCDGGDLLDVNTTQFGGTTVTARDIGASVLLSSGTGTGQLSLSSGLVTLAGVTHTGAVIPTVTTTTTATNVTTVNGLAANVITASSLATDAVSEIADGFLDRDMSTGSDSGSSTVRTPRQALRVLRNKVTTATGTLTVYKEDDATSSWTGALTTDAAADPVTAVDPTGP